MTDNSDSKIIRVITKKSKAKAVVTITVQPNAIMETVKEMKRIVDLDLMSQPSVIDNAEVHKVAAKVMTPKNFDNIQDFQYGPFSVPDLLS